MKLYGSTHATEDGIPIWTLICQLCHAMTDVLKGTSIPDVPCPKCRAKGYIRPHGC